jgi:hypothetical protein
MEVSGQLQALAALSLAEEPAAYIGHEAVWVPQLWSWENALALAEINPWPSTQQPITILNELSQLLKVCRRHRERTARFVILDCECRRVVWFKLWPYLPLLSHSHIWHGPKENNSSYTVEYRAVAIQSKFIHHSFSLHVDLWVQNYSHLSSIAVADGQKPPTFACTAEPPDVMAT